MLFSSFFHRNVLIDFVVRCRQTSIRLFMDNNYCNAFRNSRKWHAEVKLQCRITSFVTNACRRNIIYFWKISAKCKQYIIVFALLYYYHPLFYFIFSTSWLLEYIYVYKKIRNKIKSDGLEILLHERSRTSLPPGPFYVFFISSRGKGADSTVRIHSVVSLVVVCTLSTYSVTCWQGHAW